MFVFDSLVLFYFIMKKGGREMELISFGGGSEIYIRNSNFNIFVSADSADYSSFNFVCFLKGYHLPRLQRKRGLEVGERSDKIDIINAGMICL